MADKGNEQHLGEDEQRVMDSLYWWGIPTLFRAPLVQDLSNTDIGLVGVPHSTGNGTTERDQHLGPRAARHVSANGRRVHLGYQLDPWKACQINDLGDVPFPEANNNEKCIEQITAFFSNLSNREIRPVAIGGDHSITGGILQGIAGKGAKLTHGEKAALLHFDAHTDAFSNLDHFLGAKKSAAHWAAYLVQNGHVDAEHSVQIGIRGNTRTLDWLQPSYDLGYEVITMDRYNSIGADESIEIIKRKLGDRPVYITFDLDCLDPTVAPGVSNIEAGVEGFRINQVTQILHSIKGFNVIGGDVVCMMPTKDSPNNITAMVATAVLFEMIALIAERHRSSS